jgi:hypothetical protein
MFASEGLKLNGKFFAFVGRGGELIVKLPADRARQLIDAGDASRLEVGTRSMREWAAIPLPTGPDGIESWRAITAEAFEFLVQLAAEAREANDS